MDALAGKAALVHEALVRTRVSDLVDYLGGEAAEAGEPDWPSVAEWAHELLNIAEVESARAAKHRPLARR